MKLFSTVLHRKRGVILFVAAFIIPLLFVVVLSIDTFSKRQKTTRNLLESNLWLSGRSALDLFETQFNEIENKLLNAEYFSNILKDNSLKRIDSIPDMFVVNQDYQIVYPETGEDNNLNLLTFNISWNSDYREYMALAETAELNYQDYPDAIKNYQTSLDLAKTTQQEAMAMEGIARSFMASQNYQQAIRYYQLLKNKFSQSENLGGHPYGISSPLQLYSIGLLMGKDVFGQDSMLLTYQKMKDRHWLISSSSYFFFKYIINRRKHRK